MLPERSLICSINSHGVTGSLADTATGLTGLFVVAERHNIASDEMQEFDVPGHEKRITKCFKSQRHLERFVSIHDPIANLFYIPRYLCESFDSYGPTQSAAGIYPIAKPSSRLINNIDATPPSPRKMLCLNLPNLQRWTRIWFS